MKKIKSTTTNKARSTNKKTINRGGKKMIKNFVIESRDAKLVSGVLTKPKSAIKAVKAVKAVKEVIATKAAPEQKDSKTHKVIQPATKEVKRVKGVKAVKAVEAKLAVPGLYSMKIEARTKEVAKELAARMTDQGLELFTSEGAPGGVVLLVFKAETDKIIRAAFKKCKSKDGYNAAGLAFMAAKNKKKEKETKKEEKKETKKEEKKETKKDKKEEKKEESSVDWPGS